MLKSLAKVLIAAGMVAVASVQAALAQSAPAPFKAAAVAYDPQWGDLEGNIARIVAAIEKVADSGARLMVFPEQATTGYIFDDFQMVRPYLDTIPGKTTNAIAKVARARNVYVAIGIAELDPASGLGYNSAALIGPEGYIGKYRKTGLNSQDQRWVSQGNLGFPVFDTELGRIMLLICYDDTYWQYGRMAALHNADIIAWSSVSDRVMPGTPKSQSTGNHSTVANVQYLSKFSGAWVVGATRNGIETNPITKQKLYYNGGSSIWTPVGNKVAQAGVFPPETFKPGLSQFVTAEIDVSQTAAARASVLSRRRPELYGLLALHRSPTDANASTKTFRPTLAAQAAPDPAKPLAYEPPPEGGLLVLPALFHSGPNTISGVPPLETEGGPSEQFISALAQKGKGYVVGSYAQKKGRDVFHTVSMADPGGAIVARYHATHPTPGGDWMTPGNKFVVVSTSIGRVGLVLGEELEVPEVFGNLSALRADVIAAPARQLTGLKLQIDPKLFVVRHPPDTPFDPYAAAKLSQTWLAIAGWNGTRPSTWVFGPEPVIETAPVRNGEGQSRVERQVVVPWPGTWINQQQLIAGQQPYTTIPLVLDTKGECYRTWSKAPGWKKACW